MRAGEGDGFPHARGQEGVGSGVGGGRCRRGEGGGWVPASARTGGGWERGAVDTLLEAGIYSFGQLSPSRRPVWGQASAGGSRRSHTPERPSPSLYMKVLPFPYDCCPLPVRPRHSARAGAHKGRPYGGWGWVPASARTRGGQGMGSRRRGNNGWGEEGGRAVRVPLLRGTGDRFPHSRGHGRGR